MTAAQARASRGLVLLAFAAVYLIWGSTYLAIRFALETLPPFLMVGFRYLVAGGLLLGWIWLRGGLRSAETAPAGGRGPLSLGAWGAAFLVGALLLVGGNGGVVWAEYLGVPSGLAALIVSTVPLWVVSLEWLGPRSVRTGRPGRPVAAGVLVGLGGVALLLGPSSLSAGGVTLLGGGALVGASLSWAFGSLISRRLALPSSPLLSTAMEMLAGGAMLLVLGLATGELGRIAWEQISTKSLLALAYLIAAGSLVGFTAYVWLLKEVPTSKVATYAYVNPVVALFLGWGLAGEGLSSRTLMAAAVILGAVVLITTYRRAPDRKGRETAQPALAEGGDCIWIAVPRPLVPRIERLLAEESSGENARACNDLTGVPALRRQAS